MNDPRSVVERFVEAVNDRDLPGARALFAPAPRLVAATGRVIDLDGLRQMLETTLTAFPDLTFGIERCVVDGDVVMTEEVMEGTHAGLFAGLEPTGKRVALPMVHVTSVTAGRITERIAYHDTAGILRQLNATR